MSKMDNLRAMREARFERSTRSGTTQAAKTQPPKNQPAATRPAESQPAPTEQAPGEELCGHKAISGRTCTRERGHSAKSHRYS